MIDIVKWDWMLLGGQVLPKKLVTEKTVPTPVKRLEPWRANVYGDGLIVTEMFNRANRQARRKDSRIQCGYFDLHGHGMVDRGHIHGSDG